MSLPKWTAAFHLTHLQAKNLHVRELYDVALSGNALLPEIEINRGLSLLHALVTGFERV